MQLKKLELSIIACSVLSLSSSIADDYVSIQYMNYDEDSGKTTINAPHIEINKDFGMDYTLNLSYVHDTVTGASPIFYDTTTGATTRFTSGTLLKKNIKYGDVNYEEERNSVGLSLTKRFESRDELIVGINYSKEYDYKSLELSAEYLYYLNSSKNQSLSFGVSTQKNDILTYDTTSGASSKVMDLDVLSAEIGFTQVLDKTSSLKSSVFYANEDGYLSNPYMRVVRDYNTSPKITEDSKPDIRDAYGIMFQYSKAFNDAININSSYRYYSDDWGIDSHTINAEVYYQLDPKLILGIGTRYYTQTKADFYSGEIDFFSNEEDASSDLRMSDFESLNYRFSVDYKLNDTISLNGSINYYEQVDYFDATYYNIGIKYKF